MTAAFYTPFVMLAFCSGLCACASNIDSASGDDAPTSIGTTPAPRTVDYDWMSIAQWQEQFAEDRKQLLLRHEQAKQRSQELAMANRKRHEEEYNAVFNGDAVETTVENIRTLLRYLNDINWGVWQLPSMTIGYTCNQYDCDGKTATTITLDTTLIHYSNLALRASFHHTPRTIRRALALIEAGVVRAADFVDGDCPLTRLPDLFRQMAAGNRAVKTLIRVRE